MEHDIEKICRELLDRSRSFRPEPESKVGPGVYPLLIDADDLAALHPLTIAEEGLVYVGMTADKAGERNHFAQEHSGFSSPTSNYSPSGHIRISCSPNMMIWQTNVSPSAKETSGNYGQPNKDPNVDAATTKEQLETLVLTILERLGGKLG
jgi:hypothetical protein